MNVAGLNILMRNTANVKPTDVQILYPKSIRGTTMREKLATLFTVAMKKYLMKQIHWR
jgi:hypothetical protein